MKHIKTYNDKLNEELFGGTLDPHLLVIAYKIVLILIGAVYGFTIIENLITRIQYKWYKRKLNFILKNPIIMNDERIENLMEEIKNLMIIPPNETSEQSRIRKRRLKGIIIETYREIERVLGQDDYRKFKELLYKTNDLLYYTRKNDDEWYFKEVD